MQLSILNFSDTIQNDGTFRLDAEHYQKQYLDNQDKLLNFGCQPLLEIISQPVMTGHTPSMKVESYYGGDIGFVKTDNLREFRVSGQFSHYLSNHGNEVIKRSSLREKDLIVTIIGATQKIVGRAALIRKQDLPLNINQNIALIRLKKSASPEFLSIYLNSKIGRLALWFLSRQTEQVNLNCREIEKVLVPKISATFTEIIKHSYKRAILKEIASGILYEEAQGFLLTELRLNNWQPKHQLSFIRNFSDTCQAGRIDAEYFQPKYDEIINAIKAYKGGWDTLDKLVDVKKSIEVGSGEYLDEGIPFVRVSNISPFEITEEKYISEQLYSELTPAEQNITFEKSRNHQPQQGEILFSKDGSPGIAYYLKDEPQKMIVSGGILRLKNKTDRVNNEYLTLVLNSVLTQEQVKRDVGGSIILHWRPEQVKGTIIPLLPQAQQIQIQQKVTESFEFRKQSKQLLENARRAVEMAIEESEEQAIKWLDTNRSL